MFSCALRLRAHITLTAKSPIRLYSLEELHQLPILNIESLVQRPFPSSDTTTHNMRSSIQLLGAAGLMVGSNAALTVRCTHNQSHNTTRRSNAYLGACKLLSIRPIDLQRERQYILLSRRRPGRRLEFVLLRRSYVQHQSD